MDTPQDMQAPDVPVAPSPADQQNVQSQLSQPDAQQPQLKTPGLWARVLTGALSGLAHGGVGGALVGGAASASPQLYRQHQIAVAQQQQAAQNENAQAQSRIKFQDAQSANAVAEAAKNNQIAANYPTQARDAHEQNQVSMAEHLQQLGITPTVIADDSHDGANGALEQLTQTHGAVPHLINLEVKGQHLAYDLNQIASGPQGLTIVNQARQAQNQPEITPAQWATTPPAARTQLSEGAIKFFAPDPPADYKKAGAMRSGYQAQLDAYKKRPDADPQTVARMQGVVDRMKTIHDEGFSDESKLKGQEAYSKAFNEKIARDAADKQDYHQSTDGADVTGWNPPANKGMSQQQLATATQRFALGPLKTAQDTDKSYEMFQDAYAKHKAGNDTTGAGDMLALSQHLATTFGAVKGARVTKDMIQEHVGARSYADSAATAMNHAMTGAKLSDNQWAAFSELIEDTRKRTWGNTIKLAHSVGIPVTSDMVPADVVKSGSASPQGKPVYVGGKLVGHTTDGKTMVPVQQ
jgi:hypothetical protein